MRFRKVLSNIPKVPSSIQNQDGSWKESSADTLSVLMETHFPGCKEPEAVGPGEDIFKTFYN